MDYELIRSLSASLIEIIQHMFGIEIEMGEYFTGFVVNEYNEITFEHRYIIGGTHDITMVIPFIYKQIWMDIQLSIDSINDIIPNIDHDELNIFRNLEDDYCDDLNYELNELLYLVEIVAKEADPTGNLLQKLITYGCPLIINTIPHSFTPITDYNARIDLVRAKNYKNKRKYWTEFKILLATAGFG